MLCLTVLPVLGVWSYSVYMLSDTISLKSENEAVRKYRFIFIIKLTNEKKNPVIYSWIRYLYNYL